MAGSIAILLTLGAATPAAARVVVSVEVVFGSVAVGGLGIFVATSGSSGSPAGNRDMPDALVEVRGTRARFGIPFAPLNTLTGDCPEDTSGADGVLLNLVRWRF